MLYKVHNTLQIVWNYSWWNQNVMRQKFKHITNQKAIKIIVNERARLLSQRDCTVIHRNCTNIIDLKWMKFYRHKNWFHKRSRLSTLPICVIHYLIYYFYKSTFYAYTTNEPTETRTHAHLLCVAPLQSVS